LIETPHGGCNGRKVTREAQRRKSHGQTNSIFATKSYALHQRFHADNFRPLGQMLLHLSCGCVRIELSQRFPALFGSPVIPAPVFSL
jgi:hypothetical protein